MNGEKLFIGAIFLSTSCYPHLNWNNPCDQSSPHYDAGKCLEWIHENPDVDFDGDGFTTSSGDCDELREDVNPSVDELQDNKIDENCNGIINEGKEIWTISGTGNSTGMIIFTPEGSTVPLLLTSSSNGRIMKVHPLDGKIQETFKSNLSGIDPLRDASGNFYISSKSFIYSVDENLNDRWSEEITDSLIINFALGKLNGDEFIATGANIQTYEGYSGFIYITYLNSLSTTRFWVRDVISSGILTGDLNSDNVDEIIFGTKSGLLFVFKINGEPFSSPFSASQKPILATPFLDDVNGDGKKEICFGSTNWSFYCLKDDMTPLWYYGASGEIREKGEVGDLNEDGKKEILFYSSNLLYFLRGVDGQILHVVNFDSSLSSNIEVSQIYRKKGGMEIIVGDRSGTVYVLSGMDGSILWKKRVGENEVRKIKSLELAGERLIFLSLSDGNLKCLSAGSELEAQ